MQYQTGLEGLGDSAAVQSPTLKQQQQQQPLLPDDLDAVSSATKAVINNAMGDEASSIKAFGSPHLPTPPASPLDAAAKQLDFDAKVPSSPATPVLPTSSTPAPAGAPLAAAATPMTPVGQTWGGAGEGVDYDTFIRDTLLWVNKVRSGVYLVGGLLLIYLAHATLTSSISLVTGACYLVLAQAALNFVRGFISPKLQERCTWYDSAWTDGTVQSVNGVIRGAAALHDRHLNGKDAGKMLKIVAVLWAISLLGRSVGLTGLVTLLWITAFVVPKVYVVFKPKIDEVVGNVAQQAKGHFLKLDAKARAAIVVVPIFVAGYALSSTDLAIAVLALLLYGRSCMAPAQVDRLNAVVAPPITSTVTKVGGTVSKLMQNAATKFDLTPTPAKAKRA